MSLKKTRFRKAAQILQLLRDSVPAGEFDPHDWEAIRVAVRLVFETEDLRKSLSRRRKVGRDFGVSYWSDSVEGALTFLSWVRELTSILQDVAYPSSMPPANLKGAWARHEALALRLPAPNLTPARRLSVLVELGGIELTLLGLLWSLEPIQLENKASLTRRRKKARSLGP
jgi:hypothetical protein